MTTKPNRIYLASRYSRREELCSYREQLRAMGLNVQARWPFPSVSDGRSIARELVFSEADDDASTEIKNAQLRSHFANDDWEDVTQADLVISFTEPPRSNASRGGRHVEYGIALAKGARVIVVGYRENIFHWLPQAEFYSGWESAKLSLLASLAELNQHEGKSAKEWFLLHEVLRRDFARVLKERDDLQDAYTNMKSFAVSKGLNVTAGGQ